MKINERHDWDVEPEEARSIQEELSKQVRRRDGPANPRLVAGADCSFHRSSDRIYAAAVLYDVEEQDVVEEATHKQQIPFPYVPGLLSFREMPGLLPCFRGLTKSPDLVIADGHGYAHPRRFGLACHLGLFLERPVVGCAKSVLVGEHETPGNERGSFEPLRDGGEIIGSALRTRDDVRPVFVSSGHRISLPRTRRAVLNCGEGYRIPEPQRQADLLVGRLKEKEDNGN